MASRPLEDSFSSTHDQYKKCHLEPPIFYIDLVIDLLGKRGMNGIFSKIN